MDINKRLEGLAKTMEEIASRDRRLQETVANMADGMALLLRNTLDHSDRIEKLEGGQTH